MSLQLTKIAETSTTITLGWTPPVNVGGYVFYANGKAVSVATANLKDGTPRKEVKFSKTSPGPPYEVVAVTHPPAIEFDAYPDAAPPPPPPPPPPTGNPYFVTDYSSGKIGPPWTNVFSYTAPGYNDLTQSGPITQSPDGRVSIVNDPVGSGTKVLRCEIRDSDPDWAVALNPPVDKSEVRSSPSYTWNKSQAAYGDVRWFSMRLYAPYNATEKFEWAHTGGNAFFDISDMHPDSNSWPAIGFSWYPSASPEWAKVQIGGGATLNSTQHLQTYNLWQMTDSAGARVMANHNRWITVVWGARFHYDFTGWFEAWVDGVNVVPRVSRPTMWINDFAMYWKHGVYKQANAVFPESGRSVLYFGRYAIGMTKADVE